MYYYKSSLIPLQKVKEAFCATGSRMTGVYVGTTSCHCFPHYMPACTQQGTTLTFIKTNVPFLLCEKFFNHQKLLQLLMECQSSNSRIFRFLKLLCVWAILIKIFISQSKCFIFLFTNALTLYFESSLLYKILCIYFQVTISLTRFHSNSNILF